MSVKRIGLVSSTVPLINGGARFIVEWLEERLKADGYQVESILIPTTDDPETIIEQMSALRIYDFDEHFDRVITFRPPSHAVRHRDKFCWFIHHIRIFYDLWETEHRGFTDTWRTRSIRDAVRRFDSSLLTEAKQIYTNSKVISRRLEQYNGISAPVLYPPVHNPAQFRTEHYGDEIVSICRMEPHKRQDLMIDAMKLTKSSVRLRLCGAASNLAFADELAQRVRDYRMEDKIVIEDRWITEDEKVSLLSTCLASVYVPFDEDSYGYPTLEAAHARKATISTHDSGGVPEFVRNMDTGLLVEPTPQSLAEAFDSLYRDKGLAQSLGERAATEIDRLGINWATVIRQFTK